VKLHNTRTRQTEPFTPLDKTGKNVTLYSCGPTVYSDITIGNLSAFIMADTLRRTLTASGYSVKHVMNYTDVDDKTIRRSRERYPEFDPHKALHNLTREYIEIFNADMQRIGNDMDAYKFVRATEFIKSMQKLIAHLYAAKMAYIAEDGVYFSIEAYRKAGYTYGQLSEINTSVTASARIQNDEYNKESAQDFALWKIKKEGEPSWDFKLGGTDLTGRPGWHIECSVMSTEELGQPFDIHTGGVDLIFPHHENEIAQSTASGSDKTYATYFVHNDHLLVDGRKMSKSLGNFYTLENIVDNGHDPLAFRLMMLQAHYRSQTNFTWENVAAAGNRLNRWRSTAVLRFQPVEDSAIDGTAFKTSQERLLEAMQDDLDTPAALAIIDEAFRVVDGGMPEAAIQPFTELLELIDKLLGLNLLGQADITAEQRGWLHDRFEAKKAKDFAAADKLRDKLLAEHIEVKDSMYASLWTRSFGSDEE
jgi:cysteinyl-tRNA synthetase